MFGQSVVSIYSYRTCVINKVYVFNKLFVAFDVEGWLSLRFKFILIV